jgi:hypothetical protein
MRTPGQFDEDDEEEKQMSRHWALGVGHIGAREG